MSTLEFKDIAEPHFTRKSILKSLRRRIDPEAAALGSYKRLPSRRGRRVTQEELAECVGVTRVWYATLESGGVRASLALVDRLAVALMLTPRERFELLSFIFPELTFPEEAWS